MLHIQCYAVADALSHAPDAANTIEATDHEHGILACTLIQVSAPKLNEMQACTTDDNVQRVVAYIQKHWPDKIFNVPPSVKPYYSIQDELNTTDGFVCYDKRIVIPQTCQQDALSKSHMSHRGIVSCKNTARQSVYRPRLNKNIEEMITMARFLLRLPSWQTNRVPASPKLMDWGT